MQRVRLVAHGRVQGVGFRDFVARIGTSLGLTGYAKNLPDGTVEIVAEGKEANIEELKRRVSVRMPLGISVEGLRTSEISEISSPSFASFGIQF